MTLGNLLTVPQILPAVQATERWGVITELVDLLVAQNQIKPEDRDTILGALRQREETMSTGIGFGIAIPHASSDRVEKVVAAFGRSSAGIAKFLNDRAVRERLGTVGTAEEILEIFRS